MVGKKQWSQIKYAFWLLNPHSGSIHCQKGNILSPERRERTHLICGCGWVRSPLLLHRHYRPLSEWDSCHWVRGWALWWSCWSGLCWCHCSDASSAAPEAGQSRTQMKLKTSVDSSDKSGLWSEKAPTKYPVTFDSVSMGTTGSHCSVSVEPVMVHCTLSGARSGAGKVQEMKIRC